MEVVVGRERLAQRLDLRLGRGDVDDEAEQAAVAVVDTHALERVLEAGLLGCLGIGADAVVHGQLDHVEAPPLVRALPPDAK